VNFSFMKYVVPLETRINDFLKLAKAKHGDRYSYEKLNYFNADTKVTIVCPVHGEFEQIPYNHTKGKGCLQCGIARDRDRNSRDRLKQNQENAVKTLEARRARFLKRSRQVHKDRYEYDLSTYFCMDKPTRIICPIHGEFWQIGDNHIFQACGCPRCQMSKGEQAITNWLTTRQIEFRTQVAIPEFNRGKRFDFFFPQHGFYLEFDGELHYAPNFGRHRLELQIERDRKANIWCACNNVRLVRISYLEDLHQRLESLF